MMSYTFPNVKTMIVNNHNKKQGVPWDCFLSYRFSQLSTDKL